MRKTPPRIGPRHDFPVKRLVGKLILANMVFFGGIFLLGTAVGLFSRMRYGNIESLRDFSEVCADMSDTFVTDILMYPERVSLLFVAGTFGGVIWYWIARHLETRKLKKRFGLLTKSCTSPTPDVKSPDSRYENRL